MLYALNIVNTIFVQLSQLKGMLQETRKPRKIFDLVNSLHSDILDLKKPSPAKLKELRAFLLNFKGNNFEDGFVLAIDLYLNSLTKKSRSARKR